MGGSNVVATEHGRYSLFCMQKRGSVWYIGKFKQWCRKGYLVSGLNCSTICSYSKRLQMK